MFTIDLLKGQGVPIKSRPEGIIVAAATLIVPILIAMVMFSYYLHGKVVISIHKQEIVNYEAKINALSDTVELQKSFEEKKEIINSSISEVKSSIGVHVQWTPVLTTLVENMPDSMVLTKLEVERNNVRKKIPKKDDPQKLVDVIVPIRTLQIGICGHPQNNYDEEIRGFSDRLRSSNLLGAKFEDIRVSQELGVFEDQEVVSYVIDCIFKPGL